MGLLYLVITIWLIFIATIAISLDNRRPMSTKLIYKYRIKDDSIFRKIIKFKDKKNYICNYFKVVPVYVFLLLAILGLILLFVDIFTNGIITNAVHENMFIIIALCVFVISILYFLVIIIWWEIVDYNELKLTKAEKEELKQLRTRRKENKNNKR